MPIFAFVIWFDDLIVKILSAGGGKPQNAVQRSNILSEATEYVEEGDLAMRKIGSGLRVKTDPVRPTRRKAD